MTNVELRLVGVDTGAQIILPGEDVVSTTAVGVNVGDAHKGASIIERTLGGSSLQVKLNSWHDGWVSVRYILR